MSVAKSAVGRLIYGICETGGPKGRPIVIRRLIGKRHVTEGAFGRIATCALTWRKRGPDAYGEFYRRPRQRS